MNFVGAFVGLRHNTPGSCRNPRSVSARVHVDTDDTAVDDDPGEFRPRVAQHRVHPVERRLPVPVVECGRDRGVHRRELVVPLFDHRVRWRGDDELDAVVWEREPSGVAGVHAVACPTGRCVCAHRPRR
jgi:hypothetical protein